ncbi:Uncharacterised protein [Orientia tsutsugamushi]|uniref:Uncharacterized protein n=1 Tax=Orientia tsutsugamushi TaxID=784 RepID=A0A2U3RA66_ORITS|nr:Uncharacterised protein [Orientia tsutsugamushi]
MQYEVIYGLTKKRSNLLFYEQKLTGTRNGSYKDNILDSKWTRNRERKIRLLVSCGQKLC